MTDLTKRQRAILDFIRETTQDRGYPPSVREIGDAVGLASPSSVHSQLETLKDRGYLGKDPAKPRSIQLKMSRAGIQFEPRPAEMVPLIGEIAAGSPVLAQENYEDTLPLPRDYLGSGNLFALKVKGDSMINAGILPGDLAIIRQQTNADEGEIVAALVDGEEATIKRFSRKRGKIRLLPENDAYEPIESDDIQILGKLVGLFRAPV